MDLRGLLVVAVSATGALFFSPQASSAVVFSSMTVEASSQATGQEGVVSGCRPAAPTGCGAHVQETIPLIGQTRRSLTAEAFAGATSTSTGSTVSVFAPTELDFIVLPDPDPLDVFKLLRLFSSGGGGEQSVLFASARARASGNMTLTVTEHFDLQIPLELQGTDLVLVSRTPIDGTITSRPTNTGARFLQLVSSSLNDSDSVVRDYIGMSLDVMKF
jgi:hypothetical protein